MFRPDNLCRPDENSFKNFKNNYRLQSEVVVCLTVRLQYSTRNNAIFFKTVDACHSNF